MFNRSKTTLTVLAGCLTVLMCTGLTLAGKGGKPGGGSGGGGGGGGSGGGGNSDTNFAFVFSDGYDLYKTTIDDGNRVRLTNPKGTVRDRHPEWSHDGQQVAFIRYPDPTKSSIGHIYVVNADGSGEMPVLDGSAWFLDNGDVDVTLTWSPNGQQIIFASGNSIWAVEIETGIVDQLIDMEPLCGCNDSADTLDPAISPLTGELFFYSWMGGSADHGIYVAPFDVDAGSGLLIVGEPVPVGGTKGLSPAVSPNGEFLAFWNRDSLIVRDRVTSAEITILSGLYSYQPEVTWSPDGLAIGFWDYTPPSFSNDLYFISADGASGPIPVTLTGRENEFQADWNPAWMAP